MKKKSQGKGHCNSRKTREVSVINQNSPDLTDFGLLSHAW